jgi:peptide/nickel transport system substrate-binding protein
MDPTYTGENMVPDNNSNGPQLTDPKNNKAIDAARLVDDPAERADAWAQVDDMVTATAAAIPYIWDDQANIQSANVAGVINKANANWDLAFTSLKAGD